MAAPVKEVRDLGKGKVAVIKDCNVCGQESEVVVWQEHYEGWLSGIAVENAFPAMTLSQRKTLILGVHEQC